MRPLLEAGVSRKDAQEAYKQHILATAQAQSESARESWRHSRMRAVSRGELLTPSQDSRTGAHRGAGDTGRAAARGLPEPRIVGGGAA